MQITRFSNLIRAISQIMVCYFEFYTVNKYYTVNIRLSNVQRLGQIIRKCSDGHLGYANKLLFEANQVISHADNALREFRQNIGDKSVPSRIIRKCHLG